MAANQDHVAPGREWHPARRPGSVTPSANQGIAAVVQSRVTPRTVAVELFLPFHHVALAAVFRDQLMDVIAALAGALGAFDAKHVELAFDVAAGKIKTDF
jgi:hypothetical protein